MESTTAMILTVYALNDDGQVLGRRCNSCYQWQAKKRIKWLKALILEDVQKKWAYGPCAIEYPASCIVWEIKKDIL